MKNNKEYDGVIYEPGSGSSERNTARRSQTDRTVSRRSAIPLDYERSANGITKRRTDGYRSNGSNQNRRPGERADGVSRGGTQKKKKSSFALFYVFTLFTGIMICIVIFTIFFNNLSKEMNRNGKLAVTPTPAPTPTEIVINEMRQVLGVIDSIDVKTGSLHLLDASASQYYDLYYDSTTELSNKFGQAVVFSEFKVGDMVDANFNPKTSKLKSLSLSSQAWEYRQIKNVIINATDGTITIGNDIYDFDDNLIVMYNGENQLVHSVREIDLLTVRGYRNKVSSIIVLKSHGSIEITNKDYIVNGFVEVDTDIAMGLEAAEYIELQEGAHRVVVKGNNIEPYIREIELGPRENIRINLEDAVYKTGLLFINANVSDYVLVIDDKQVSSDTVPALDYGTHTIRLEKPDYEVWQKDIVINLPRVDINANMTQIVKMGKLTVNTTPAGAQFYIDNKLMGSTPFEAVVEQGTHNIVVRMSGYKDTPMAVEVTDVPLICNIQLQVESVDVQTTVTAAPEG